MEGLTAWISTADLRQKPPRLLSEAGASCWNLVTDRPRTSSESLSTNDGLPKPCLRITPSAPECSLPDEIRLAGFGAEELTSWRGGKFHSRQTSGDQTKLTRPNG